MKLKLEDELRRSNEVTGPTGGTEGEIARRKAESRLFGLASGALVQPGGGLTGAQSDRIRQEMQRYATMRDPRLR